MFLEGFVVEFAYFFASMLINFANSKAAYVFRDYNPRADIVTMNIRN